MEFRNKQEKLEKIYIVGRYLFRLICTVLIWSQKIDCLLLFLLPTKPFLCESNCKGNALTFLCVRLKKRKLQSKEPLTVLASPSFVCLDRHSVFSISCKKNWHEVQSSKNNLVDQKLTIVWYYFQLIFKCQLSHAS